MVNLGGRRFVAQRAPCSATHITVYRAARQLIWGLPVAFTKELSELMPSHELNTKIKLQSGFLLTQRSQVQILSPLQRNT